jgi:nicotinamide mononucleotide (NMN) deamidase PncC
MVMAAFPVAFALAWDVAVTVTGPGGPAVGAVYIAVFVPVEVTESFVPLAMIAQVTA